MANRPTLQRQLNARHLLDEVREMGSCTRAQLARRTQFTPPTVSKLVDVLLRQGLLEEEAVVRPSGAGRPSQVYRLAHEAVQLVGVVVDLRQCTVVAAGLDAQLAAERQLSFATPATYPALLAAIAEGVREVVARHAAPCLGVGVTTPGLVHRGEGRIVFSPNLHLLDGHCLAEDLGALLPWRVVLCQEEHALCLAEQLFGEARDVADFALIDVTTGLGMGAVNGGLFVSGQAGFGGELGHINAVPDGLPCGCGKRGCLETVATDRALRTRICGDLGRELEMEAIVELARAGDPLVAAALADALRHLAGGIGVVVNLFNPSLVLVHGRMFDLAADAFTRLLGEVEQRAMRPLLAECRIVRARSSKRLGALAAIIAEQLDAIGPRLERR